MIFYHLDRLNTFPSNPEKQLIFPINTSNSVEANLLFQRMYPDGISRTGERYLCPFDIDPSSGSTGTISNFRIYTIEYIFETVRLLYAPDLPSRFTSLFACKDKSDINSWYQILLKNSMDVSKASVKIVETDRDSFTGDSKYRDENFFIKGAPFPVFSPFAYHVLARDYWSGKSTSSPLHEVLCRLPVRVLDSIPVPDFFQCIP